MTVGNVKIGSAHPIARQTMTTSNTRDVQQSVDQVCCCRYMPLALCDCSIHDLRF
jgi:4-hydroxy-3-methylbut-2-en-1-yl diphosphate synthase IspG/GcpE